ncbi:MAG: hypothetical protein JSS02_21605 [Planctomycetes bacterium]|nr:hypothetical protein [Planctomycetota bacterium]
MTRLVNIKSSGVTISSFGYRYDKTTRRTGVTEASGDRVTWTSDPTYQLVNEKRSGVNSDNVTYTYDPAGNRTVKMESGARTTSTYHAANRLKTVQDGTGRTTLTFDASGNQTKQVSPTGTITTSVWTFENMNTATKLSSSSIVTLVYNGDQMRIEKDSSSSTRKLIYVGQNILQETDGSNLTQAGFTLEPQEFGIRFENAYRSLGAEGTAPDAFNFRSNIFIRASSSTPLGDVVHEGTHAQKFINASSNYRQVLEMQAHLQERFFRQSIGFGSRFNNEPLEAYIRGSSRAGSVSNPALQNARYRDDFIRFKE